MLNNPLERYLQIYSDKDCTKRINHIDDAENIEKLTFRVFINCDVAFASKEYVLRYLLDNLELELESVEKLLNKYIGIVTGKSTSGPITFTEHSTELLISFNYSKIAQKLYGLSDDQVAYIDSNNVIGDEPSMNNEQAFDENTVFIKFFKRFRRIYRDCNCEYNKKITDKLNKDSTIAIFGHSLDLSDKSILKPLFESRYARYDIYCYQDINSYKIKLAKLIGLDLYDELEQDGKIHLIQI